MRNLINFLVKNHYYFLFLLLEGIAFTLIFTNRSYQSASYFNTSRAVAGYMYTQMANMKEYVALKDENDRLAQQNALLLNMAKTYSYEAIRVSKIVVNDTLLRKKYIYIPAKVISNTVNRRSNYITLNVGKNRGVEHDMAIINSEGIVGVVKDVSENFSSCLSILNKDVKVNCKIKKDGSYGPLSWEKDDDSETATLTDIPIHARFKVGDTILTSALSSIFPENIMVGTIKSFERKVGEPFYTLKVQINTKFRKLNHVFVIRNVYKAEQDSLEKVSQVRDKDDK